MPRADAGNDQSVRTCQIVQLDGSRSFDPQGGRLTYLWQLVNAPLGSAFFFDGYDGQTFPLPTPTGFTHKFYAASLGVLDGQTAIVLGSDLLSVQGASYVITAVGTRDVDGILAFNHEVKKAGKKPILLQVKVPGGAAQYTIAVPSK